MSNQESFEQESEVVGKIEDERVKLCFSQDTLDLFQMVLNAPTDDLFELAKIAGLNPLTDYAGGDFRNIDLSDKDLSGADLSGTNFLGANLSGTNLSGTDLTDANLSDANLSGANLSGTDLIDANLSGANLSRANLSGTDLTDANLSGTNLSGANLSGTDLTDANLSDANLSGANLSGASLSGANLSGANLSGALIVRAFLSNANFSQSSLVNATLLRSNLSQSNLREARLNHSNLLGCNLSNTDLSNTDLSNADLSNTDLTNSILKCANLSDVNLSTAIVEGARFADNKGISEASKLDIKNRKAILTYDIREILFDWKELSSDDREWMIKTGESKEILDGTKLIEENKSIDGLFIILRGEFVVSVQGEFVASVMDKRRVATLSGGEVVGEMSFVRHLPPSATVEAVQNSCVWVLSRNKLTEKLNDDLAFSSRFYKYLAIVSSDRATRTTLASIDQFKSRSTFINSQQSQNISDDTSFASLLINGDINNSNMYMDRDAQSEAVSGVNYLNHSEIPSS